MQSSIDLLMAYANKIAFGLAIKEQAVNERTIQQEGRTVYSLNMPGTCRPFRRFSGPNGFYNTREEASLCNQALQMVEVGKQLNDLFGKRTKLLIENAFSRNLTLVKEESDGKEGIVRLPVDSFKGLDIQPRWAKQKIRQFVVKNYKKTPGEIKGLMKTLDLPSSKVKQWISYNEKSERVLLLREQVIKLSLEQPVTLLDLKRLARRIYKTRMFRASDKWCHSYIRKYRLQNVIQLNEKTESE